MNMIHHHYSKRQKTNYDNSFAHLNLDFDGYHELFTGARSFTSNTTKANLPRKYVASTRGMIPTSMSAGSESDKKELFATEIEF